MPPPGTTAPAPVNVPVPPIFTEMPRCETLFPPDHTFEAPTKQIVDEASMATFLRSEALGHYLHFIQCINMAVKNKKNSDSCHISEITEKIIALLDHLDTWIAEIPPLETPQRFGNKAFRTYIDRLENSADALLEPLLPSEKAKAVVELKAYFIGGFGHGIRLDYGSGHEMAFVAFLCCLYLLDVIRPEDAQAVGCKIFVRYLELVRKLQKVYTLEPAGSHGVWGLDDHQFLPYYWGSSQLYGKPQI
ncbi:Serine/threonine-protein phosphatase 2A activator [Blyttiomyces sp. JEL0837]|nr:Serine/threonine-protein phosphatase 2A activator [Blyttiomyces sp. JEL0837]